MEGNVESLGYHQVITEIYAARLHITACKTYLIQFSVVDLGRKNKTQKFFLQFTSFPNQQQGYSELDMVQD